MANEELEFVYATLKKIASKISNRLNSSHLEQTYQDAFYIELNKNDIKFLPEKTIPVFYGQEIIAVQRIDIFLPEYNVIIELKSLASITSKHIEQTIRYMEAMQKITKQKHYGVLINFGSSPDVRLIDTAV